MVIVIHSSLLGHNPESFLFGRTQMKKDKRKINKKLICLHMQQWVKRLEPLRNLDTRSTLTY